MLKMIVDNRLIYVVTGGVCALGVVSKIISNLSVKRMVKAAGNMSKSNHGLMRLVRAKFEHACMVSEKVENVSVFVEKYLYEYKALGMKLHTWRRIQVMCVALCLVLGALGAFSEYSVNGMGDGVIQAGAYGGILGMLLYLFHLTSDENYRMDAVRNYMVDYLENVCLHKYEKIYKKEVSVQNDKVLEENSGQKQEVVYCDDAKQEPLRPHPAEEVPTTIPSPVKPPAMPEPYEVPDVTPPIKALEKQERNIQKDAVREAAKENLREVYRKEERKTDKDVLIRQILEEFMA